MPKKVENIGRPSIYSDILTTVICERISSGESLNKICKDNEMPHQSTIYEWLLDPGKKEFSEKYMKAKNQQAENLFDELLDIADDGTNDYMEKQDDDDNKAYKFNGEAVARSRLRVDTRKWYLSKVLPKKYGDKLEIEQNTTATHTIATKEEAKEIDSLIISNDL